MDTSDHRWLPKLQVQLVTMAQRPVGPDGSVRLLAALKAIDVLLAEHRAEIPNDLVHYLERRSYEKASKFCQELALNPASKPQSRH